jgi:hypothetical protein
MRGRGDPISIVFRRPPGHGHSRAFFPRGGGEGEGACCWRASNTACHPASAPATLHCPRSAPRRRLSGKSRSEHGALTLPSAMAVFVKWRINQSHCLPSEFLDEAADERVRAAGARRRGRRGRTKPGAAGGWFFSFFRLTGRSRPFCHSCVPRRTRTKLLFVAAARALQ